MPNLAIVEAIASNTPQRTVTLSGMTVTVLFTALDAANRLYDWQGAGFDLTPAEIDEIQAILGAARHELMGTQVGEIRLFASAILPPSCLLCNGDSYNRVDYPDLYAVLAPGYIVDADTFIVPDLRDRFVLGAATSPDIGATGGEATHILITSEIPSHAHGIGGAGTGLAVAPGELPVLTPSIFSSSTGDTGGGGSHNNMPPYETLAYYIVAR